MIAYAGKRVAVVGGGWAGLSAAEHLARQGICVTVYESTRTLGGRARCVSVEGHELDNGQHILIGAYRETLSLMRRVGADPEKLLLRLPLDMRFADGFHLRAPSLPYPFNLAAAMLRAKGLKFPEALAAVRFMAALQLRRFRVDPDRGVAQLLAEHHQPKNIVKHLWEPLCVSALNTPLAHASAQVFANVLRDGLTGKRENSDLLVPRTDLGTLLPDPAAAWLRAHGGSVETGAAIKSIHKHESRWRLDERDAFDSVILAVAPQHALALLPDLPELAQTRETLAALEYEPIVTCYLQYAPATQLPSPMLGFTDGLLQWAFDRGQLGGPAGLVACVISASGAHEDFDNAELARRVDAALRLGVPGIGAPPQWTRVIAERRATFSCMPNLRRPGNDTGVPGLLLAGDYTASDYPGTLEAAVKSGLAAAEIVDPII